MVLRSQHLAAVQIKGGSDTLLIWMQQFQLHLAVHQHLVTSVLKCCCSHCEPTESRRLLRALRAGKRRALKPLV